jgi:hypothetical protein
MALYISDTDAAKFGASINLGVFIKILLASEDGGPLRLWLGVNDIPHHFDALETEDSTYYGGGRLQTIPDFDVIINGAAERINVTMEGVSADAAAQIDLANPQVHGKRVFVGMAAFNQHWEKDTDIFALSHWISDFYSVSGSIAVGSEPQTRTLALSCSSGEMGRSRPRRATYTDPQQKFRYPDDDYCRNVTRYDRGFSLSWPRL